LKLKLSPWTPPRGFFLRTANGLVAPFKLRPTEGLRMVGYGT